MRRGSLRVRRYPFALLTTSVQITSMAGLLMGWSLFETSGSSPATAILWDGANANGKRTGAISVAAGGESQVSFFDYGVDIESGLYLAVVAGSITGVIYFQADMGEDTE